jgi:transposase
MSQHHDNEDPVSLKRSQKYRQFAAVGRFVTLLKNVAAKYAIMISVHEAKNTTRICQFCNHLNPAVDKEQYQCENCHRLIKQDQNAAVNLSRFEGNEELAEMALEAGQVA